MGLIITASDTKGNLPADGIRLMLECDVLGDIFCRGFETFEAIGYIEAHSAAMNAGWMERQSPRGRLWACPRCSGK